MTQRCRAASAVAQTCRALLRRGGYIQWDGLAVSRLSSTSATVDRRPSFYAVRSTLLRRRTRSRFTAAKTPSRWRHRELLTRRAVTAELAGRHLTRRLSSDEARCSTRLALDSSAVIAVSRQRCDRRWRGMRTRSATSAKCISRLHQVRDRDQRLHRRALRPHVLDPAGLRDRRPGALRGAGALQHRRPRRQPVQRLRGRRPRAARLAGLPDRPGGRAPRRDHAGRGAARLRAARLAGVAAGRAATQGTDAGQLRHELLHRPTPTPRRRPSP